MNAKDFIKKMKSSFSNPDTMAQLGNKLVELAKDVRKNGKTEKNLEYQKIMFHMYYAPDNDTYGVRNYFCSLVEPIEAAAIPRFKLEKPLPKKEFREKLAGLGGSRVRVDHPMTTHLLSSASTDEEVDFYIKHNWYRARNFYKIIADISQRVQLNTAWMFYSNLLEEVGGHKGEPAAHTTFFLNLMKYRGIEPSFDEIPEMEEALEYLNHRKRCARAPNIAWGLSVFYAIESTAGGFATVRKVLTQRGVPKEYCTFHHLHSEVDCDHEKQVMEASEQLFTDKDSQEIVFTCIKHHQNLSKRYFDAIWKEMQSLKSTGKKSPKKAA